MPPWSIKNVNLLGIIELISAYETACTICARIVVALEPKAEAPNDEDVKLIVNYAVPSCEKFQECIAMCRS
jgi:hypothetical protein